MNVLVIGGVAAGTKIAAKLKRECPACQVQILTKGADISYAGCGLPYYVGHVIEQRAELVVNTPEAFTALTGAQVRTGVEVTGLDRAAKTVTAKDLTSGQVFTQHYDKLVIATGAHSFVPQCEGTDLENVFFLRTPDDAVALRAKVDSGEIKRAVIVGGGFIGLESAENLANMGVKVSVIDFAPHVLPELLDPEFSTYVENAMAALHRSRAGRHHRQRQSGKGADQPSPHEGGCGSAGHGLPPQHGISPGQRPGDVQGDPAGGRRHAHQ